MATVIPLRKEWSVQAKPPRKEIASRIEGHREWSHGGGYQMVAASDGSVELISPRRTVHVADGKRLMNSLGRFNRFGVEPWSDGDLSVRWVYGDSDGTPGGSLYDTPSRYWLWLDITIGERVYPATNERLAGQTYIDKDHIVLTASSASYHAKKLRNALRRLA